MSQKQAPDGPKTIDLKNPPACRIGCLTWVPQANDAGAKKVLVVQANYAPRIGWYQLPGGHAWDREQDWLAMGRHVRRETGLVVTPTRLLGKDWVPYNAETGAAMGQNHIYLCEPVSADAQIVLPAAEPGEAPELTKHLWIGYDEPDDLMQTHQRLRFKALWEAWEGGTTAVMEHGKPIFPVQRS
ncbi:NUDIX domain-containing protein [Streptomyces telluris]|uniref:NUDIX domain-containing protein n=1 Tax=Streptomyces telluris TaxID=2720021 RepID=A0A9X2LJ21_9ACTN|nr:NUDIX domain-containing protein [Streptomyces telluris]MCQ8772103.1 NUDIX domain-containing protein [Streptomyces telluris]NJP82250.1 NUDIX domain-containing protein [Streptomyces telluris]